MRLSNSHSWKVVEPRLKIQSLDFGEKQCNISPNQSTSTCLKLMQIPLIKGFCFLKNVYFKEAFILSSSSYSIFQLLFWGFVLLLNHNVEELLRQAWFQMMLIPDSSIYLFFWHIYCTLLKCIGGWRFRSKKDKEFAIKLLILHGNIKFQTVSKIYTTRSKQLKAKLNIYFLNLQFKKVIQIYNMLQFYYFSLLRQIMEKEKNQINKKKYIV